MKANIKSIKKGTKAFAIVEAMVSALLFVIGFIGLITMQNQMLLAANTNKYRAEAIELANEITSDMLLDNNNLSNYADGSAGATRTAWDTVVQTRLPNAASSITIVGSQVTVRVRWRAAQEVDEHQYEVVTLISYNS